MGRVDDGIEAGRIVDELHRRGINTTLSARTVGVIDFAEKHVDGAVRVSPHYYNTEHEVDAAVSAVREIAGARG